MSKPENSLEQSLLELTAVLDDRSAGAGDGSGALKTRDELQRTLRTMQAIMRHAPVGIAISRDQRMVTWNARFAEIFALPQDTAPGFPARELHCSDEQHAALGTRATPLLVQGEPFKSELAMRRRDGAQIWVRVIVYVLNRDDPAEGTLWIIEDRAEHKSAEEALQRLSAEQQLVFDNAVVGIAFLRQRRFVRVNRRLEEMYGYTADELIGNSTTLIIQSEDYEQRGEAAYSVLARGETYRIVIVHRRRDGTPFWVSVNGKAIDPAQPHEGSIWNFEDVTASRLAEESLRESETLQRAILESASLMLLSTDAHGVIVTCNVAAERMLKLPASAIVGRRPTDLFEAGELEQFRHRLYAETGQEVADPLAALLLRPSMGHIEEREWTLTRGDGGRILVQLSISPLREHARVNGYLFVAGDITQRRRAEDALRHSRNELAGVKERAAELEVEVARRRDAEMQLEDLALHDGLTGLPNRTLLRQRLGRALAECEGADRDGALYFIDLDRFKTVNDSLGHHVGDRLLKEVAQRIAAAVRIGDTVARLGGDEFVVVVADAAGEHALQIAHKIRERLEPPMRIGVHELTVTASIGVALFPRDGKDADTLLQAADKAMYAAKSAGRNAIRLYDPSPTIAG